MGTLGEHMAGGDHMTLLPLVLGFAAGLGVGWAYIRCLKGRITLYETYIHDRIDAPERNHEPHPSSLRD